MWTQRLAVVLLSLLSACRESDCNIDYIDFKNSDKPPFIYIIDQKEKCTYEIKLDFWLAGKRIHSDGELSFYDNAFHLKIDSLNSSELKFFDFSKKTKDEYSIFINLPTEPSHNLKVKVDDVIIRENGTLVHIFRFKEEFVFEESKSDLVFFVTRENGIIGSYISDFHNGVELVISESGNFCGGRNRNPPA